MSDAETAQSSASAPAPAVKPGYKTTEGWLSFIVAIATAATGTHFVGDGSTAATVCGLVAATLTTIVYTLGRAHVKANAS